jgi:hypothetical protein
LFLATAFCAPHAHPVLTTAMAFVSYGFVLVRVRVVATALICFGYMPKQAIARRPGGAVMGMLLIIRGRMQAMPQLDSAK